jgi:hypothetical protein
MESIEVKISILDRRRDNLFKVLEIFKNLDFEKTSDLHKEKMKNMLEIINNNDFELIKNNIISHQITHPIHNKISVEEFQKKIEEIENINKKIQ